jgi:chromosomal replication initiator protein
MSLSTATVTATANPWLRILAALEKKISRHSFDTWLKPTRFSHTSGEVIFVRVPTAEFRNIGDKFGDLIQEAMDTLAPEYQEVKFITAEEDPTVPPVRPDGGFAPVSVPTGPGGTGKQQRFD